MRAAVRCVRWWVLSLRECCLEVTSLSRVSEIAKDMIASGSVDLPPRAGGPAAALRGDDHRGLRRGAQRQQSADGGAQRARWRES